MPHRGAMRNLCRQLAPICAKVWRADSDAIVRTFTAEIFLRTFVLYSLKWLAVFLASCCIAFCKGNLLSSFLPRVIFVSLRTPSAENQLEPGSYAVLLLWCRAFLCWQLRPRFFVDLTVSAMPLRSHENTGWLPIQFPHLSDKMSLIS